MTHFARTSSRFHQRYPARSLTNSLRNALISRYNAAMKDMYDLHPITTRDPPSARSLARALRATFERRGTWLEGSAASLIALSRDSRLQGERKRFLQDSGLRTPAALEDALILVIESLDGALR